MKTKDPENKVWSDEEMARTLNTLRVRFVWATNALTPEMDYLLDNFIAKVKKDYTMMTDAIVCFGRDKN